MTGEVEMEGGVSFLHCSVNGVKSRPKLVILDNTVHLFSMVRSLRLLRINAAREVFVLPLMLDSDLHVRRSYPSLRLLSVTAKLSFVYAAFSFAICMQ